MTLVKGLVEDLFEDIADVTLIEEDAKPILTLVPIKKCQASGATWWPNFVLMQEFPTNSCWATC